MDLFGDHNCSGIAVECAVSSAHPLSILGHNAGCDKDGTSTGCARLHLRANLNDYVLPR